MTCTQLAASLSCHGDDTSREVVVGSGPVVVGKRVGQWSGVGWYGSRSPSHVVAFLSTDPIRVSNPCDVITIKVVLGTSQRSFGTQFWHAEYEVEVMVEVRSCAVHAFAATVLYLTKCTNIFFQFF